MNIKGIEGIIFDMDGTLTDSETNTEKAVEELLTELGIDFTGLDIYQFHAV